MPAPGVALKLVVTPVLIGGATIAGRRMGAEVAGWLVALPFTSGPLALFLAIDQGGAFASSAAVGMLAGTISQVVFATVYRIAARRGIVTAASAGCLGFTITTLALSAVHLAALPMFAVVMAVVVASNLIARAHTVVPVQPVSPTPRWDIPARMLAGTAIVLVISALAPLLGAYLAGLLSPFPVFAGVLTVFTHQTQGKRAAIDVLAGFLLGLASPAVFLLLVAVLVQPIGLSAFAVATAGALLSQGLTMRLLLQRRKVGQDLVAPRLHDVDDLTH